MAKDKELILLIENDPDISDLIARQALIPLGYRVKVVRDANKALKASMKLAPDLVIANLNSTGLSGKDLLVAFTAQNFDFPVIVLADKEQEREVMRTLRLGAVDYLLWPLRETEVVTAVEHALKQTRGAQYRRDLDRRLRERDRALAAKTRELEAILEIGNAVASISNQRVLFEKIVTGAKEVVSADIAWLLLRDESNPKSFLLAAQKNLPASWAKKINKPLDDGVSSLVALSGETLSVHGRPLKRFKISALGKSAAVVPIKTKNDVIGLLVVVRNQEKVFTQGEEALLSAVGDYASISLVNAKLFQALQEKAKSSHYGEREQKTLFEKIQRDLQNELKTANFSLKLLREGKLGTLNKDQQEALNTTEAALVRLKQKAEKTIPLSRPK